MSDENNPPLEGEIVNPSTPVKLTKFNEDTVQMLERAFNTAFNITEACQFAGISRETYYNWLAEDDVFSYRMSIAQAAPNKKAKEIVIKALQTGDTNLALKFLMLRDPDFNPKIEVKQTGEADETRNKIKEFLNDTSDFNDAGGEPTTDNAAEGGDQVAQTPSDIS